MKRLWIIADDLTGAIDTGIKFADQGILTCVLPFGAPGTFWEPGTFKEPSAFKESGTFREPDGCREPNASEVLPNASKVLPDAPVVVINTMSRHDTPKAAKEKIKHILCQAQKANVDYIYKKTDATLRGNIGAELGEMAACSETNTVAFLPSFPEMGRTVHDGICYVNGIPLKDTHMAKDPFTPVKHSRVRDVIAEQTELPVIECKSDYTIPEKLSGPCIHVLDGETREDLDLAAKMLRDCGKIRYTAGCSAFARSLLPYLGLTRQAKENAAVCKESSLLIVCGSVNETTLQQTHYAGYDFIGWYHTGNGYQAGSTTDTAWHFTDQENAKANTVGEILGTDKTKYAGNCTKVENGVYYVKLCADWRENVKPNLTASLSDGKNAKDWHNALTITLTYSDNVGVTKLYGKRGSEEYRELTINTNATTIYTDLEEGSHTYTFKAEDAAGNVTETKLTAKLDTVKPILGEAKFSEGHKSIWDWIIKKDSLFIEIPVTETGSGIRQADYTLTPETGTPKTGTAKIITSGSTRTVQVDIASDFKGTVTVTVTDNAGNVSDEKKIGADGTGLNGVIVESNAPTVTIQADRTTTDEQGGTNSVALSETEYYNTAPRLRVHVEDKEPDTAAVNAGIASVTWQINDEAEYSAGANFDIAQLTEYDFTITALEGRTGDFTVTIRTCDHADD